MHCAIAGEIFATEKGLVSENLHLKMLEAGVPPLFSSPSDGGMLPSCHMTCSFTLSVQFRSPPGTELLSNETSHCLGWMILMTFHYPP